MTSKPTKPKNPSNANGPTSNNTLVSTNKQLKDTKEVKDIKEKKEEKKEEKIIKLKGHGKSNSNVGDFAFQAERIEEDIDFKYENFANNFDDLVKGIKNSSASKLNNENPLGEKTLQKHTQSTQQFKTPNLDPSFISQVDKKEEKIDLQQLTNIEEIKDFYDYTENCLMLINRMKIPDLKEIEHLQLDLPSKLLKKKLAIFDLDETLVHCELKNIDKADKVITIKLKNGTKARVSLIY